MMAGKYGSCRMAGKDGTFRVAGNNGTGVMAGKDGTDWIAGKDRMSIYIKQQQRSRSTSYRCHYKSITDSVEAVALMYI